MKKNKKFSFNKFENSILNSKIIKPHNYIYISDNLIKRYLAWKRLFLVSNLLEKIDSSNNNLAVDFGCQRGLLMAYLCSKYKKTIGVDIKKEVLNDADKILKKEGFNNYQLVKIDKYSKKLPFKDKSVDLIACTDVLEHIDNLDEILSDFKRILKKTGYLVLSIPTENLLYKLGNFIDYKLRFSKKTVDADHINKINEIKTKLFSKFKIFKSKNLLFCFWIALLKRK